MIPTLKKHCAKTVIFKCLYEFLEANGYIHCKSDFREKYAVYVMNLYDDATQVSSSINRVPSIFQLCEFLGVCLETATSYWFNKDEFKEMFDDSLNFKSKINMGDEDKMSSERYSDEEKEYLIKELKNSQVFLSTHNTDLISNDILRPDAYFLIRDNKIRSFDQITDKELRRAHNIQKMYKAGAFNE